jgi:Putative auto-transporter adhesin, head GIN domain
MYMKKIFPVALCLIVCFSSCQYMGGKRIRGNGVYKTESRTVGGAFEGINVSGNTDVYVKQDSIVSIRIETDENLLPYIVIENKGGTLDIRQKEGTNLKSSRSIKVYVSGPSFKRFDASGACDFYSENMLSNGEPITISLSGSSDVKLELKAPKIDANLSGAGTISLKGETKDFQVDGSGSTNIRCFELLTENTRIELSGAGNAEIFASVKLDAHVSGAADIRYKGNATVTQDVSGAGSIKKVE